MTTHIGIMPFDKAEEYGIKLTNKLITILNPHINLTTFLAGEHKIILNINGYTADPLIYKEKLLALPLKEINPVMIVIQNEELLLPGNIQTYLDQLSVAVNTLTDYKVVNGGLTLPAISYWYWSKTKDNDKDFFIDNIPTNQKPLLEAGNYQSVIDKVEQELNFLKTINSYAINIHYYFGLASQVEGIVRMINFIKEWTGKPVVSDEAGMYATGLLPEVVGVARETEMKYLVLYCGDGSKSALPITKEDYLNAIK